MSCENDLNYLKKLYLALSPSIPSLIPIPIFPTSINLSKPLIQSFLVNLINSTEPITIWKKLFWRRIIKSIELGFELRLKELGENIEDEEVREEILEELLRQMMGSNESNEPGSCLRIYQWGEFDDDITRKVKLIEEGKVISAGTTGLRTWQAGIFLANHLIADPSILSESNSTILELGSGVGLLTLVLAKLTHQLGRKIIGTDVDELVLERLKENVQLNSLEDQISVTTLDWELALKSTGTIELKEWETKTFGSTSSDRPLLILGSDITYDPVLAEPLVATLQFLLRPVITSSASPSTHSKEIKPIAYISVTIRIESTFDKFINLCREKGLKVEEIPILKLGEGKGIVGGEGWEKEGEVKLIRIVQG